MEHTYSWWSDVIMTLAERRARTWKDRLGHSVGYRREDLSNIARDAIKAQKIMDESGAISWIEQAFLSIEAPFRQEWQERSRVVN